MINEGDINDIPQVLDILLIEYQLRHLMLFEMHVDVQLHREEGLGAVHNGDEGLLKFETLVVGKGQATDH